MEASPNGKIEIEALLSRTAVSVRRVVVRAKRAGRCEQHQHDHGA